MAKITIEVCMISARSLPRSSSLWKLQWFVVGWINPNSKYCSRIDRSGSSNPTWKTKFSVSIDDSKVNFQDLALTIEVHSREPIFLREKLHGTASILLKEFLLKFAKDSAGVEETGSFQLRKNNKSGKPQGFIDVSLRISEETQGFTLHSGSDEDLKYPDQGNVISLAMENGEVLSYPTQQLPPASDQWRDYMTMNYPHYPPQQTNYQNRPSSEKDHHRSHTPPPPPPPANTGFIPSLFPGTSRLPESHINLPSTGPGFSMGVGAGALAAGAMIFGDDFMSASNSPSGFEGGNLTLSADPPF